MNMKMSVMAVSAALLVVPAQGADQLVSLAKQHPVMAGLAGVAVLGAGAASRAVRSQPVPSRAVADLRGEAAGSDGEKQGDRNSGHTYKSHKSDLGQPRKKDAQQRDSEGDRDRQEKRKAEVARAESPTTTLRILDISKIKDRGLLKARGQEILDLECALRQEEMRKEAEAKANAGVLAEQNRAKEAQDRIASEERTHAQRLEHEARESKLAREHAVKLQAEKLKADATLVASFVEQVPTLLRALRDHAVLSTPAPLAPIALPVPAPSVPSFSTEPEAVTPVSVASTGSVAAHIEKLEAKTS